MAHGRLISGSISKESSEWRTAHHHLALMACGHRSAPLQVSHTGEGSRRIPNRIASSGSQSGKPVEARAGELLIEVAGRTGIEIPSFCCYDWKRAATCGIKHLFQ
jgi:hypothetical protein